MPLFVCLDKCHRYEENASTRQFTVFICTLKMIGNALLGIWSHSCDFRLFHSQIHWNHPLTHYPNGNAQVSITEMMVAKWFHHDISFTTLSTLIRWLQIIQITEIFFPFFSSFFISSYFVNCSAAKYMCISRNHKIVRAWIIWYLIFFSTARLRKKSM